MLLSYFISLLFIVTLRISCCWTNELDSSYLEVAENAINACKNAIVGLAALNAYQHAHIEQLESSQAGNQASNSNYSGTTSYIRWGRNDCPSTSVLVYEGYAGKAHYTHGGGVNYQCLPTDPEWPENASGGDHSKSYIYGVEYEHYSSPVWPVEVHDHDAPCALCLVEGRSTTQMIPAKQSCPNGWTEEYDGFLVSAHHVQKGATFECLDFDVEFDVAGHENKNGGLFYIVEAKCGSLPCPPYVDGKELSCVVCTK